ncbi:hypothetical protein A2121_03000 [Candidatus Nomurabacteria bacterium GWB1_40_6]|uniref:PKD domain-containing protein n=1 Tax=Candidatus Nomurabacteria bacterium GWB1_40_6 TaxID=1801727 RepID=A0A1F6TME2_9BACT|nr:MAG: hypothetical protein A2121_03000 [Candidatus Nomurabacteria bacterium GWB1_40_6]
MSKKLILALVVLVSLFKFGLAEAQVVINEIMYAPANGESEWVEILNSGSDSIDLSDWRFFNNKESSAPLRLQKGSAVLLAGGYATITTTAGWSSFSGTVFSSSQFSLPNDSSKYSTYKAISNSEKQIIDSVTYATSTSTSGTGNSLSKISGSWVSAISTPGAANQNSSGSSNEEENLDSNDDEEEDTLATSEMAPKLQKPKVQIVSPKIVHIGVPFTIEGKGTGTLGEKLTRGRYYWNFDDGDFREVKATITEKFTHTYFYSGDYIITFEHYPDVFTDTPDAMAELTIKALEPKILISRVGEANDFFIELTNSTGHNANISDWILISDHRVFTFPKNTTLSSNKKMTISPKVSGFSIEDKSTLKLMTPEREVVFKYMSSSVPQNKVAVKKSSFTATKEEKPLITAKNLTATSILGQNKKTSDSSSSIVPIVFLLFVGASAGGGYFIRRRRSIPQISDDDFEILDE